MCGKFIAVKFPYLHFTKTCFILTTPRKRFRTTVIIQSVLDTMNFIEKIDIDQVLKREALGKQERQYGWIGAAYLNALRFCNLFGGFSLAIAKCPVCKPSV
jgi:hypothetical protein